MICTKECLFTLFTLLAEAIYINVWLGSTTLQKRPAEEQFQW